jgi:hypothetical protein
MNLSLLLTTQTLGAPAPFPKRPIPEPEPREYIEPLMGPKQPGWPWENQGPKGPGAVIEFPSTEVDPEPPKAREVDPEPPK